MTVVYGPLGKRHFLGVENSVRHVRHVRMAGLANFLLGAFLVRWPAVLPIPLEYGPLQRSLLIVGGLVAVCSAARLLFPRRYVLLSAANLVCGFWILLSPVTFRSEMTWQMVIEAVAAGIALMSFALWSISESADSRYLPR